MTVTPDAKPVSADALPRGERETIAARNERIFQALPRFNSLEYDLLLRNATAEALPAQVLVRAYRKLHPSGLADRTLARLVGGEAKFGYLGGLYAAARRRASRLDAYSPEDLVQDTIGEIIATLAFSEGKLAEGAWTTYVHQCMEHAYREFVGRRGERAPRRVESADGRDVIEATATDGWIPWHGRVAPDNVEWLEGFMKRTALAIPDEQRRAIALDMISERPTPVTSDDPNDTNTLTARFGKSRFVIMRSRRSVKTTFRAALERQNERDIDISFLSLPPDGRVHDNQRRS